MEQILSIIVDPILPVFAVLVLGFCLSLGKIFDTKDAASINRFVFYLAVPSLIFGVLIKADTSDFQWSVIAGYFASEVLIYAAGVFVARALFGFRGPEALLLGMTACFSNHILFVLPIAMQLYGEQAGLPIAAIITLDAALIFGLTVLAMEFMTARESAVGFLPQTVKVMGLLARNPMLLAIFAGILVNIVGLPMPSGMVTFTGFAGAAAAPVALFALGILLARSSPGEMELVAVVITILKLVAMPALFWACLYLLDDPNLVANPWRDSVLLVAAGPCGAMPFVLAMQYGVRPGTIAKAIVYSTTLSIVTLALIA